MLNPTDLSASPYDCFRRPNRVEAVGAKSLLMTGSVVLLALLTQQPVRSQQVTPDAMPITIESRTHYSFEVSYPNISPDANSVSTGASQPVTIERLASTDENAPVRVEALGDNAPEQAQTVDSLSTRRALYFKE